MKKANELSKKRHETLAEMNDLYRDLVKLVKIYNLYTQASIISEIESANGSSPLGSFLAKVTNAREGRDKGYYGREERIRFTIEGQNCNETRKQECSRTKEKHRSKPEEKRHETSNHERQP
jgi:hypothetical protein